MSNERMWIDKIVEEVREVREVHARQFDYDLHAIFKDLKQQKEASQRKIVRLTAKQPTVTVSDTT